MKIAIWDLECSSLQPTFGIIICAGIKPLGKEAKMVFKGRKGSNDKELVKSIKEELEKYDMLISYNGLNFDLKYLNTRLMYWRIKPLDVGILHLDMCKIMKKVSKTNRFQRNSLDMNTNFYGIKGKNHVDPVQWMQASLDGDKKALAMIVDHCKRDVEILEELYNLPGMNLFIKNLGRA